MNNDQKKQCARLILIMVALLTFACKIVDIWPPTPTPTATSTLEWPPGARPLDIRLPTPIPTATSTPTQTSTPTITSTTTPTFPGTDTSIPEPHVDISWAVLTLNDFPAGFEELSPNDLGIGDLSSEELEVENTFFFIKPVQLQLVVGLNFLLIENINRISFDAAINQPDLLITAIAEGLGTTNVRNWRILGGLGNVGTSSAGIRVTVDMEETMRMDIVLLRRDVIGVMLVSLYREGYTPSVFIQSLAFSLDQRIRNGLWRIR